MRVCIFNPLSPKRLQGYTRTYVLKDLHRILLMDLEVVDKMAYLAVKARPHPLSTRFLPKLCSYTF
jgi:hypothetical protein